MRALKNFTLLGLGILLSATTLFAQPVADFTSNKNSGCSPFPLVTSFQDQSTGNPTSWLWDFGDGSGTSTLQNPTYTFSTPGCYDISLTATNAAGSNTLLQTCFIEIFAQPVPDFTLDVTEGCAPITVSFTDNSLANAPSITTWSYILSDGSISSDPNPVFTFPNGPDTINVILQVTNSHGCLNTLISPASILVYEPPVLDFAVDVNSACSPPLMVNFTNNTLENGANNITYQWNFPGGTVSGGGSTFSGTPPPPVTYGTDGQFDVTLELNSQNGCADTLTIPNMIGIGGVTASFTSSATQICQGDSIVFTNTSVGGVTSIEWNFGENAGIDATADIASYVYNTPGQYSITLRANNSACGDTLVQTSFIEVLPSPTAAFTPSQTEDCQPGNPITFTDQSIGATGWLWDFGDSTTVSTQQSPVHTFTSFGIFNVCVVVTNAQGCVDTLCSTISISPPNGAFNTDPREGCAPLTVQLTDQSTSPLDPIVSWNWDFGAASASPPNSAIPSPSVTYPDSGVYDITLIIVTAGGCTDTVNFNNAVEVGNPPLADFIWDKDTVCINEDITFISTNLNPTWEYLWDFQYQAPGAFALLTDTATTIYPDTGLFSVALIINNNGCRDTMVKSDLIFVSPPLAEFAVSDTLICSLPTTVTFTDQSIGPADIYEWQLNNAPYSSLQNPPPLTISATGIYLISQIITNSITGCTDTFTTSILAGNPIANFISPDTIGCHPNTASFVNLAQNQVLVQWKFDLSSAGANSQNASPTYTYQDTGKYTVRMIAIDQVGCRDTLIRPDYITVVGPYAAFSAVPVGGCPGDSIQYFDNSITTSASTPVGWDWDFDDGSAGSSLQNPFHTFAIAGFYDITLVVTDDLGCTDSLTIPNFTPITFPTPNFLVNDSSSCAGNLLDFESYSNGFGLQYAWDFGDGNVDSVQNPMHAFSDTGYYHVSLILTDVNGCIDSLVQDSFIYIEPFIANFGGDPILGICPPLSSQFTDSTIGNVAAWDWDFGDSFGGSNLQDPGHVYLSPGTFDVQLIATHEDGCQDTLLRPDYVFVAGPNGDFIFDDNEICVGDTICITAIADAASCAAFDFRDGFVDNICGLSGIRDTIEYCYVYQAAGTFFPVIILEDAQGCVFTLTSEDSLIIHGLPDATILPQDTAGCTPFTVPFSDTTTLADTSLVDWIWSFGDGDSAFIPAPFHTFTGDTVFPITLIVTDGFGCRDTNSTTVTVFEGTIADFVADDTVGCPPLDVTFSDLSSNVSPTGWTWIFGDGDTLNGSSSPTHTYTDTGLYTVTLIVADGLGCADTLTKSDYIYLRFPEAHVYGTQTTACNPVTLTFYADSSIIDGIAAGYSWCLTDLATNQTDCFSTGEGVDSIAINFPNSGDFEMTVTIRDKEGCEDTSEPFAVSIIARVIPPPLEMRNVSVVDEQTVEISWAPFPGTDFVEYQIYRASGSGDVLVGTVDNINTTVFREMNPGLNVETNVQCYRVLVRNTCDEVSILADTESHCTIDLETTQGTDAITLDWTPYVGYVVNKYEIYQTDSYTPGIPPVFVNEVPGNVLSYLDEDMYCRDSVSYRVLAIGVNAQFERSFSDLDGNLPFHPVPVLSADISQVSVVDDSFLSISWNPYTGYLPAYYLLEKSFDGQNWEAFDSLAIGTQSRSDTLVKVDEASYYYRVFAVDECGDVSVVGQIGKSILLQVQLDATGRVPQLLWSEYEAWALGIISYQVEVLNDETGEWDVVDLVAGNRTRYDDNQTRLFQATYCYRVRAFEAGGEGNALSNEVCVTFRPRIYVPNAFTPNNDGKNDRFLVYAPNMRTGEIVIFNRWGDELYRSFNFDNAWDGMYQGSPVQEGVYVFTIKGVGEDGTEFVRRGTVTLLR